MMAMISPTWKGRSAGSSDSKLKTALQYWTCIGSMGPCSSSARCNGGSSGRMAPSSVAPLSVHAPLGDGASRCECFMGILMLTGRLSDDPRASAARSRSLRSASPLCGALISSLPGSWGSGLMLFSSGRLFAASGRPSRSGTFTASGARGVNRIDTLPRPRGDVIISSRSCASKTSSHCAAYDSSRHMLVAACGSVGSSSDRISEQFP
mmetsp:Transcript_9110/g.26594  ORF Transcript_9110/g.26594 Transcript_9110/m.26594 type:complete len:208 (-) Transcript_9110:998-1621(-)